MSASDCPEAAAAMESAGQPIDYFIPDCPSPGQLSEAVADAEALAASDQAFIDEGGTDEAAAK